MSEVLLPVAGALLLGILGVDVLITVFHPQGHGGPITRRQNRGFWRLWKAVSPTGEKGESWLALGGPVLALITPAVWGVLLVCGFALIYYPWIDSFLVSPGSVRVAWSEALYFSMMAGSTLGTGDLIPDQTPLRLLSVAQAFSGFALVTSALTYVLSVLTENGRKVTLASELAEQFDAAAKSSAADTPWQRESWLDSVTEKLLHVTHAHAQYPILHYYRPRGERTSLTLQIRPLVERALEHEEGRLGSPNQGERAVLQALARYLAAADYRFLPDAAGVTGRKPSSTADRYDRLLRYLRYPPL